MITEAFFWILLLAELAAIILLFAALLEKIRHISKIYLNRSDPLQITASREQIWLPAAGLEGKLADSRGQPQEGAAEG